MKIINEEPLLNRKLDQSYMRLALDLALKAEGHTSPNPMVGAVVVKSGKIISRGYHKKAGLPHAETIALRKAGSKARGADLYVNLEPCCHQGETPPCTNDIVAAGIKKVVMGIRDPNRLVSGKGIYYLRKNGVEVVTGVLEKDCQKINESFFKYIRTGRPWVILKSAISLDGKIATRKGESKWITGPKSREYAHQLRSRVDAILIGSKTIRSDDPRLTVRLKKKGTRNPARVILAGKRSIPDSSRVFKNAFRERVIYAALNDLKPSRKRSLQKMGVEVVFVKCTRGLIDLSDLLDKLGEMGITSVMVEGGSEVSGSIFTNKLVDKVIYFIAPKIIGGKDAPGPVGGQGINNLKNVLQVKNMTIAKLGDDLMVEGYI